MAVSLKKILPPVAQVVVRVPLTITVPRDTPMGNALRALQNDDLGAELVPVILVDAVTDALADALHLVDAFRDNGVTVRLGTPS